MQHDTVIVVAGGPPPSVDADALPAGAPVVAADGGLDHALALGLHVDVAVGDFDSVRRRLAAAEPPATRVERHPRRRTRPTSSSHSTPRRALDPAADPGVGSDGGRLDHLLATAPRCSAADATPSSRRRLPR